MFIQARKILSSIKRLLVVPGVFFLFFSCENDIEKIQSLSDTEMPELAGEKIEIIYTDSSRLELKMTAPSIRQFSKSSRPYIEFPEGVWVEFYNDSMNVETVISANHAYYFKEDHFWEARGNVIVHNLEKGEKLNSEELFWDENERIIYSNSYSKIENADGVYYGQKGFESNERFTKWKLKGSKVTVNFKEENNENEK